MRWVLLTVAVVLIAGVTWWCWPSATSDLVASDAADAGLSLNQQTQRALEELADAGVRSQQGVVVEQHGTPVSGARVELYVSATLPESLACPVCGQPLLECADESAARLVVEGLAQGALLPPQPFAVTTTDAEGRYVFASVPNVELRLIARSGALGAVASESDEIITLHPPTRFSVHVQLEGSGEAVPGLRAWALTDALDPQEVTSNSAGDLQFSSFGEHGWVHAAPPGYLATTAPTGGADLLLVAPRTLLVHARVGGQPVDADVAVFLHGGDRVLHAKNGELVLEHLGSDTLELHVSTPSLTASPTTVSLDKLTTEVTVELRAAGRLLLTLLDDEGRPVTSGTATLENNEATANAADPGEGQLLVLGPLPEGEYQLSASAPGLRELKRVIDLKPGDHPMEATLQRAAVLKGRVLGAAGPIVGAQVTISMPGASESNLVTEGDGTFSFEGPPQSEVMVTAYEPTAGRAEGHAVLPGALDLKLEPRAAFELEVLDHDGVDVRRASLTEQPSGVVDNLELASETPDKRRFTGRLAGLRAGRYVLDVDAENREPVRRDYTLVEGSVVHDSVSLSPGAAVDGWVQDANGKPLPNVGVIAGQANGRTDEAGRFFVGGLPPGTLRLSAATRDGTQIEAVEVVAPAKGVILKAAKPRLARGRVVARGGAAVAEFEANGQTFKDPSGQFVVPVRLAQVSIWADGYKPWTGECEGTDEKDFGTIALEPIDTVEGEVVDPEGKPLGGVVVRVVPTGSETTTPANGRFKVEAGAISAEEPGEVVATRGAFFARTPLKPGTFHRLQLARGTHVSGRVVAGGRPVPNTPVQIEAGGPMPGVRSEVTDGQGRFEVDLWPGIWMFGASGVRLAQSVRVSGAQMSVELSGEGGRCSLELLHAPELVSLVLQPNGSETIEGMYPAGTLQFEGLRGRGPLLEGLPCGDYLMILTFAQDTKVVTVHLDGRTRYDAAEPQKPEKPAEVAPARGEVIDLRMVPLVVH